MAQTYNALEGELTVRGAATSSRTGTTNAVAIVGGYDASNAASEVTAAEATLVDDPTTSEDTFGTSEIPRAVQAVSANGVGTIYGVPVPETEETETVTGAQTTTLTETPAFNPDVHPDHEILIEEDTTGDSNYDTELTTNVVYEDSVSTPSEDDTANVNPNSGDVEFDSSGDYQITYTHGTYDDAIVAACELDVRYVIVLTEDSGIKSTLVTELTSIAQDFDFKRGVVGSEPEIEGGSTGSYTPSSQDWRLIEVAPALAEGADGTVRTAAAVGGFMASQPIGPDGSGLYDSVSGLTSLNTEYRASQVKNFEGVTAVTRNGVIGTAVTTSTEAQFENIYATEIIDDVALDLFGIARDYAGGPQDVNELETLLEIQCQGNSRGNPPNLGFADGRDSDPYDVSVSLGSDDSIANAGVTIVPYPIAETVNVNMTVTDGFVEFDGAE